MHVSWILINHCNAVKLAAEQVEGEDSACVISQYPISSVYPQLWDPPSAALDMVGEKGAGNLNELLWF